MHGPTLRAITLVLFETCLIVGAVYLAIAVRLWGEDWVRFWNEGGFYKALLVAGITQTCLYYADLYNLKLVSDRRELFIRILQALGAASFILAGVYYWFGGLEIGRGVFGIAAVFVISCILAWRFIFDWMSRRVGPRERLLLVGTSDAAVALARELHDRRQELGVEIVGFIDPDPTRVGAAVLNPGVVGTIDDIPAIVRGRSVDRVVVSLVDARGKLPMDKLLEMKIDGVTFDHLPSVYEEYTGKIAIENLRPSWLIFSEGFRKSRVLSAAKRALDVAVAGPGLILAAPIMALVAVAVKLTSKGPALYHQRRVGRHGEIFTVHKFRTMRQDAEAATGPVWASKAGDPRVTPIGGILRRTRLDELPQLLNVLRGEMSFVGPRPERPEFVSELTKQIPYYGQRHVVRPGLTGWAQVRYTYGASKEDAIQKLQYDLFYIKNFSIALDLYIIFETIKTVILRRGGVSMAGAIVNAMSIDVEDYFQVSAFDATVPRTAWDTMESRVTANTTRLLDLFDEFGVRATFFVLAWVGERQPALVREIVRRGHEVASHGYGHELVYNQTPETFRADIRRAKQVIEDASGQSVAGYRAPSYSITARSMWALDVLIEEGYRYDSSIFPIRHDRYGVPGSPRHAYVIERAAGRIVEAPPSTVAIGPLTLPVAGGGYFRLLPYLWTQRGLGRLNRHERKPAVFYLHPWEIDPAQPRLQADWLGRFRHYRNLGATEGRLRRLLGEFRFGPMREVLATRLASLARDPGAAVA